MTRFGMLQSAVVLALALLMMTASHVIACVPSDDDDTSARCASWRYERSRATPTSVVALGPGSTPRVGITPTVRRTAAPRLAGTPTATPAKLRRGDSPYSALEMTENWQTLDANSSIWYKIGEETSYPLHLSIWLDVYGRSGVGFSVFSPEQTNSLDVATLPKGRGSPDKSSGHDLIWTGGSPLGGIWYVLVTNANPLPVQYELNSSLTLSDRKNCIQYWEFIGPAYVLWTKCS